MRCFHCKDEIPADEKISRQSTCRNCGSYLHCCLNCKHYDRLAPKQCREPRVELVREKDRANFCDYFSPADTQPAENKRAEEARKKLEALFKKKSE